MKAITVRSFGGPECLEITQLEEPRPTDGEALLTIETIGVGFVDVMARQGKYRFSEPGFVLGLEVAGTVKGVGHGVSSKWVGKRVFARLTQGGGYAEQVTVPVARLIPLPDEISFREAVGTGINALVAAIGTARISINRESSVFIRGAGGGIGLMCVQYASMRSNTIIATTSSAQKGERLISLGATEIWDRSTTEADSSKKFDVIIDTVGGEDLPKFLEMLAPNGHYLMCGGIGGAPPPDFGMALMSNFHNSLTFHAFSVASASPLQMAEAADQLFQHVLSHRVTPVIDSVLPLPSAVEAHRKLESGEVFGKIILETNA